MDRNRAIRIGLGIVCGLTTFLVLGAGQADRGDEFIYGLVVGGLVYWASGKAFSRSKQV